MRPLAVAVALVLTAAASSRAQGLRLHFSPASERFVDAARAYQSLWEAEGSRIIGAMEHVSGLKFPEPAIEAVVDEGISRSGAAGSPMRLRASDPVATKQATLIHELGHRHLAQLRRRPPGVDEHRVLFLVLYDVWEQLCGKGFADAQVEVEKRRRGVYDYEVAWAWALAQSQEERAKRFSEMVRENQRGRLRPSSILLPITLAVALALLVASLAAAVKVPRRGLLRFSHPDSLQTQSAVAAFQATYGLSVSGLLDRQTCEQLKVGVDPKLGD